MGVVEGERRAVCRCGRGRFLEVVDGRGKGRWGTAMEVGEYGGRDAWVIVERVGVVKYGGSSRRYGAFIYDKSGVFGWKSEELVLK